MKHLNLLFIVLLFLSVNVFAQTPSGGNFTITKSVIASGGGMSSSGNFTVSGTIGQSLTGISNSFSYTNRSGFWIPLPVPPTAASASIAGKVSTGKLGMGLRNVIVHLTDQKGNIRTTRTNQFGYFRFTNIEVGQTLIVNAFHKRYQFNSQVINFDDSITGLNITPQ